MVSSWVGVVISRVGVLSSGEELVTSEGCVVTSGDGVGSSEEMLTSWKLEVMSEGGVVWGEVGFIVWCAVPGLMGISEKVELISDGTVEDVFTVWCSVVGRVKTIGEKITFTED